MSLQRQMSDDGIVADHFHWFGAEAGRAIFQKFRDSKKAMVGVDGFMGSGKSPFASILESRLEAECLRLDLFLSPPSPGDDRSYVERLDVERLKQALSKNYHNRIALVEGILLQKVMKELVPRDDSFFVYIAGVWKPDPGRVAWPAGNIIEIKEPAQRPLDAEIQRYHQDWRPHEKSDAVVLRDLDTQRLGRDLISPDGQTFQIAEDLLRKSGVLKWRSYAQSYTCDEPKHTMEPLGLVIPPILGPQTRSLDSTRLSDVLQAVRNKIPLPSVAVIRSPRDAKCTLLDGAHRYFASVALGFTHLPCHYVSEGDAEVAYRYKRSE